MHFRVLTRACSVQRGQCLNAGSISWRPMRVGGECGVVKWKKKKKIVFVFVLMQNTILRSPYAEMCLFYTMEDKIRMFKKKKKITWPERSFWDVSPDLKNWFWMSCDRKSRGDGSGCFSQGVLCGVLPSLERSEKAVSFTLMRETVWAINWCNAGIKSTSE